MTKCVLIITGSATDAKALENVLGTARDGPFRIEWVTLLSEALERLHRGDIDVILVDFFLDDSQGIETFDRLFVAAPHTPIMILSDLDDELLAWEAVQRGAQGSLSKGYFGSYLVPQSLRQIIQRKAVEEALFLEKNRAEITLNSISDAVIGTDMSGNIDYLNIAAEQMTGWSRDEARGLPINQVMHIVNGDTRETERNPVELVLQQNKPMGLTAGTILIRRDGNEASIEDSSAPIHDLRGQISGAVIVFHDITVAQEMALKMAYLAQHDFLTNLPNRVLLNDRIVQSISLAKRSGTSLAILFLDLDNFKYINDSLGHATGDKLLQSVAQILTTCVRSSDTVSRQGGDEFVILIALGNNSESASLTAEKILTALAASHSIAKHKLHVTPSIGISVYPADGQDAETLIKNADTAMYHAKEKGRNNYQFFSTSMNVRAVERQVIETNLRRALEYQEFVLHYQPKVNLKTGKITGAEALLRWMHPKWGMVLPGRFVAIAEACGLIVPIGNWVLREACEQARRWKEAGLELDTITVNISALEFRRNDFVEGVRTILHRTGLAAGCLQLEITESVLMRDAESSTIILKQLKDMGVQLAVDDFGTGYSSLSYLRLFPIDVLKIDRSFVHDIGSSEDNGIIVSAVIAMGNSLKQRVVAEGVEVQAQLDFLKALQCEEGQGYLFSRPLVAEQFATLLVTGIPGTEHPVDGQKGVFHA
ncbi:PAS domain S-box-containing protein/diguanylate cyclase (GGDEF) domain-containing protein [Trichlorobacter thiogenes]|uniref:PAS domain S-box-containing protein/diguanylate cyclase (GGDEF) domain-containing protein n=1 Tax=Trichlorobacter thiogenes TaxID=115783 RepID=A0A1T4QWS8_9BACT|nr:EAL domain-containing protein [Trichlorobacter thiogenes]SKA08174.1 PAS domain S-box-containing protein/diguanylate cyclase (GGDEF) domain-containing protein [Trichlorobacter thiogenes]